MREKKLNKNEMISWLRLARSSGVKFFDLLELHGTVESALECLSGVKIYSINEAEQEIEKASEAGAKIIAACEPEFPVSLRNIVPVITVLGNTSLLNRKIIAIVGNNNISDDGKKFSKELADDLTQADFVIASDLNITINPMIGVTVSNIGIASKDLEKIVDDGGLIVTGSPLTTTLQQQHFVQKSKIISGLSLGVIVIEASKDSESLVTVVCTLDQKKEVFVLSGYPWNPCYSGNNSLIKNGARLIDSADDVINTLKPMRK
ncbi:DNA-processing protein DprA [Wolbachia endosymbiont of Pentidionis agamae]|uniref:DNA-processing protein DprA n=1 Tax=Wolbachia endosymbiont of Pentidionis agamae TaxID=3110435 RepID=UPI002FCF74F7